jgi:hypothetical protein
MPTPQRSPNYPQFSLSETLPWLQTIWTEEKRSTVPIEVIAKHVGSKGVKGISGPARAKIAALRQFGLLETISQGKYKVSELGIVLALHKPSDPEYQQALRKAALLPPLFIELREQHPDASNEVLRISLIKERDFSEEGVRRLVKAYRDTLAFAKVGSEGYNGAGDEADEEADDQANDQDRSPSDADRRRAEEARRRTRHPEASSVTYSWPLEDADKVDVTFAGNPGKKPTRRDLEAVIDYLELVKKRTPEARVEEPDGGE